MYQLAKRKREEGQGLVEYALILVLVAVVVIVILTILGNQVNIVFMRVTAALSGQTLTGEGVELLINDFSLSGSASGISCQVTVSNVRVTVFEDGRLASGKAVSITATGGSASTATGSGTSNASGVVNTNLTPAINNAPCSGSVTVTATTTGASTSMSKSY